MTEHQRRSRAMPRPPNLLPISPGEDLLQHAASMAAVILERLRRQSGTFAAVPRTDRSATLAAPRSWPVTRVRSAGESSPLWRQGRTGDPVTPSSAQAGGASAKRADDSIECVVRVPTHRVVTEPVKTGHAVCRSSTNRPKAARLPVPMRSPPQAARSPRPCPPRPSRWPLNACR